MRSEHEVRPLLASKHDIELAETDIEQRLERWRELQAIHMPSIKNTVLSHAPSTSSDMELLFLPSHFSPSERADLSLSALASEEAELREAQVLECILQLRRVTKSLYSLQALKKKETQSQAVGTRSNVHRKSMEHNQHSLLKIYGKGREALASLSPLDSKLQTRFPPLSMSDLLRKPTVEKREVGDSHRGEGHLWSMAAPKHGNTPSPGVLLERPGSIKMGRTSAPPPTSTDSPADQPVLTGPSPAASEPEAPNLWNTSLGLTDEDLELWEREGELLVSSWHRHTYRFSQRTVSNGIEHAPKWSAG